MKNAAQASFPVRGFPVLRRVERNACFTLSPADFIRTAPACLLRAHCTSRPVVVPHDTKCNPRFAHARSWDGQPHGSYCTGWLPTVYGHDPPAMDSPARNLCCGRRHIHWWLEYGLRACPPRCYCRDSLRRFPVPHRDPYAAVVSRQASCDRPRID